MLINHISNPDHPQHSRYQRMCNRLGFLAYLLLGPFALSAGAGLPFAKALGAVVLSIVVAVFVYTMYQVCVFLKDDMLDWFRGY